MSREMIASKAPWVSEYPADWKPIAFKRAIKRMATGLNPRDNFELNPPDADIYYVTIKNFKNGEVYLDEKCDKVTPEAWKVIQERSDLHKGDLLFASISEEGNVYVLEDEPNNWNINESVFCIRVDEKWFTPEFFAYMITNQKFYSDLRSDATGTTFLSIKQNKLKESIVLAPPLLEQQAIVRYLDAKCSVIDEAIERHKKIIEKLEEYRKAHIFDAMGQCTATIPAKHVFRIYAGATPKSGESTYWDGDIAWVTPADFKTEDHYVAGGKRSITEEGYASCNTTIVPSGSIIVSKRAPIGTVSINTTPLCTNQGCLSCVVMPNADVEFYYYALIYKAEHMQVLGAGTTFQEISSNSFANMKLPYASLDEQKVIAQKLNAIDTSIQAYKRKHITIIEKLEEYRKSIIYNAVTGKLDCREAVK